MKFKKDDIVKIILKSQIGDSINNNNLYQIDELINVIDYYINNRKTLDSEAVPGAELTAVLAGDKNSKACCALKDLELVQRTQND